MRRAVWRGALVGMVLILAVGVVTALVEQGVDDVDESGWRIPLFFAVLAAFFVAGFVSGRALPDRRLTVGILAAIGAFALWLPIRVVIWAVRDDAGGLVTGSDAVLRPGQVLTAAIFACGLGALGGLIGGGRAADQ